MGYYVKAILGAVLFCGSVALFNVKLLALLETGTCASGGPYVSARPCPEGTGTDILLLVASIFGGLIGAGLFAARGRRPGSPEAGGRSGSGMWLAWAIFFTVTGAVTLYAGLVDESFGEDAKLGGLIVGGTFLLMGLPVLAFLAWARVDDWRDPPPDQRFQLSSPQPTDPPARSTTVPTSWPMAGPATPDPSASSSDDIGQLERLQRLRESGALTDAEFEQQKRRILED